MWNRFKKAEQTEPSRSAKEQFQENQREQEQDISKLYAKIAALEHQLVALRLQQTWPAGQFEAITRIHTNHRLYVDTRDISVCSHLMTEGIWEQHVERVLADCVKPGMRCADIGANFGYYTVLLSAWAGRSGHVFSFEANPYIAKKLKKSVAINGLSEIVTVFPKAVSDKEEAVQFVYYDEFMGGGHIGDENSSSWTKNKINIETVKIDDILADVPQLEVMKIDIEGGELKALAGAQRIIERSKNLAIIIEFFPAAYETSTSTPLDFLKKYEACRFHFQIIRLDGLSHVMGPQELLAEIGSEMVYIKMTRTD